MFFKNEDRNRSNFLPLDLYIQTLKESMAHLNRTCRYQEPEESMDILPKEFLILPSTSTSGCSIIVKKGVALTDALDAVFNSTDTDTNAKYVIDCLVANFLVAAQATRKLFNNDEEFNAFVDKHRGGPDKPIFIRVIDIRGQLKEASPLYSCFGVPDCIRNVRSKPSQSLGVRFAHMSQPALDLYAKKHDFLTAGGFHHIVLPDQSILAFAPEVGGKFASSRELAQYLLDNMNADLSTKEWLVHCNDFQKQLNGQNLRLEKEKFDKILNFVSSNLEEFIECINTICSQYQSSEIYPKKISELVKLMGVSLESPGDYSFIVSFFVSLKAVVELNKIKISPSTSTLKAMVVQAARNSSELDIDCLPNKTTTLSFSTMN